MAYNAASVYSLQDAALETPQCRFDRFFKSDVAENAQVTES
jgi:hypothetical protein